MTSLSVIIPGYNTPDALWTRCLQSVLAAAQRLNNSTVHLHLEPSPQKNSHSSFLTSHSPQVEIICVDDGSSVKPNVKEIENSIISHFSLLISHSESADSSLGLRLSTSTPSPASACSVCSVVKNSPHLHLYTEKTNSDLNLQPQPQIKWLYRETNGGLSKARNSGLEIAQGEYVTFVDSDDEIKPETFTHCLAKLQQTQADICLYGVDVIWYQDGIRKHDISQDADYGVMNAATVEQLYYGCLFNYSCNKVYRKAFLDSHNLRFNPDGMPCEDIIFNLNCLMSGAKWCSVSYEGYVYYRSGSTQTSNYLASYAQGTKLAADTWAKYCAMDHDANQRFHSFAELSECQLLYKTWDNLWWRKSPYSLSGRYHWLKSHASDMGVSHIMLEFLKKLIYYNLRKALYIHPVRNWHLKRVFPNIEKYNSSTISHFSLLNSHSETENSTLGLGLQTSTKPTTVHLQPTPTPNQ